MEQRPQNNAPLEEETIRRQEVILQAKLLPETVENLLNSFYQGKYGSVDGVPFLENVKQRVGRLEENLALLDSVALTESDIDLIDECVNAIRSAGHMLSRPIRPDSEDRDQYSHKRQEAENTIVISVEKINQTVGNLL